MSLGFNLQKPIRTTNLGGSVGNVYMVPSNRRTGAVTLPRLQPALPSLPLATPPPRARPAWLASQPPPPPETTVQSRPPPGDDHWVYATALADLHEDGTVGGLVAQKGARILLVYPQKHDRDTGRVTMRVKIAEPDTGQLRYAWVEVFSGLDSGVRSVDAFSVVP